MNLLIVAAVFVLAACNPAPSLSKVAADAKNTLQAQLDHEYGQGHPVVQKVQVVKLSAPKYDGTATITANGTEFTVSISVTSDGTTTLVSVDDQKLAAALQLSLRQELETLEGKYSDYVLSSTIFKLFPASLKADKADFQARLDVVTPIATEGDFYFGSGCKAHECGSNEAAWAIDRTTGAASAVIMKQLPSVPGGMPAHVNFQLYGRTANNLPTPLADWASGNGMNEMNVVEDNPTYQPPQR